MAKKKTYKIAIIGSGIAGLNVGYILAKNHHITIYEKSSHIGGNARTVDVKLDNQDLAIDTGSIIFNYKNYPNFTKSIKHLELLTKKIKPSFSVSFEQEEIEFNTNNLKSFFMQPSNFLNLKFYRMQRDIKKFKQLAPKYINNYDLTIKEFLEHIGIKEYFLKYYMIPLFHVVFGENVLNMKAGRVLTFLDNLGLLYYSDEQYIIEGGIREYIRKLKIDSNIKINSNITQIERMRDKVSIKDDLDTIYYDKVIFASHPKDFLDLIIDIEEEEFNILNTFEQQDINTILHSSTDFMPIDKKNWAMCNYKGNTYDSQKPLGISYHINAILEKDTKYPIILSTNYTKEPDFFYDKHTYKYPIFTKNTSKYQERVRDIQGYNNCFYCGSYLRDGNYEDAISSAIEVCHKLDVRAPWAKSKKDM